MLTNPCLSQVVQKERERVGAPRFDEADASFAKALQKQMGVPASGLAGSVMPYSPTNGATTSSDIGEASAVVPLAELGVAVRPLGTALHHWVQTSCAAHPVGDALVKARPQTPARARGPRAEGQATQGRQRKGRTPATANTKEAATPSSRRSRVSPRSSSTRPERLD